MLLQCDHLTPSDLRSHCVGVGGICSGELAHSIDPSGPTPTLTLHCPVFMFLKYVTGEQTCQCVGFLERTWVDWRWGRCLFESICLCALVHDGRYLQEMNHPKMISLWLLPWMPSGRTLDRLRRVWRSIFHESCFDRLQVCISSFLGRSQQPERRVP